MPSRRAAPEVSSKTRGSPNVVYVAPTTPPPSRDTKLSVGSIYDEGDEDEITSILQPSKHLAAASYRPKQQSEPRVELNGPASIPERRTLPSLTSIAPTDSRSLRERPIQVSVAEPMIQQPFSRPSIPQLQMTPTFAMTVTTKLREARQALQKLVQPLQGLAPRYRVALFSGLAAVATILLLALLIPRSGTLYVTVAGPGNAQIDDVSIFLDNVQRCTSSPCKLVDLEAGSHLIRTEAPGFEATTERAVVIVAGHDVAYNLALVPKEPPKSGLEVGPSSIPIRIFVDGAAFGSLPVSLSGLEPKSHLVRFEGSERYEPSEQRITLTPGKSLRIDAPTLKAKPTKLELSLAEDSHGAIVIVDGNALTLPATLSLDPTILHRITATLAGHDDFTLESRFDRALEEKLEVSLQRSGTQGATTSPSSPSAKTKAEAEPPAAAVTYATLNLNSLPAAAAFVNGQSVGSTPRLGVRVRSGQNSVLFVHPTKGRKQVIVSLSPGEVKTVAVRL